MSILVKVRGSRNFDVTSGDVERRGYQYQDLLDENEPVIRRNIIFGVENYLEGAYDIPFSITDDPLVFHFFEKGMLKRWRERGGIGHVRQIF